MKSIRIRLTDDQVTQLAPLVKVLEEHTDSGVGCIGQVLFYDDETVLLVGVMKAEPLTRVREFTLDDGNLFELSPSNTRGDAG